MKKIATLALFALCSQPLLAQTSYFEGPSVSAGLSSNKTTTRTAATGNVSGSSSVGVAKLSYGFATSSIFKLGVSVTTDLKNSDISANTHMSRNTPGEFTLEPGVLLTPVTMAYAKLGGYSATYTTPFGSQNVSGNALGLGVKTYLTQRTFIQGELTQHKAKGSTTLGWDTLKQTSTAVLLGYNY
jgi:hypothetical protein